MQPFIAEPLPALKKRFSDAVKTAYNVEEVLRDDSNRPGTKREHIFDFEDGIRLIISRDRFREKEVIHFSASTSEHYVPLAGVPTHFALAAFLGQCTKRICELSGCNISSVKLIAITTGKGVPHWIVELSNLN